MLAVHGDNSTHHSKGSSANLLEDVVVVVHAVLGLDLYGLRDVLGIDVEHKLVVIPDFTFLSANLLASFRVN